MLHLTERIKRPLQFIWNLIQSILLISATLFLTYVVYLSLGILGLWPLLLLITAAVAGFYRNKIPFLKHFLTDDDDDDSDSGFYDLDVECELSTTEDRKPQRRHDKNNPN